MYMMSYPWPDNMYSQVQDLVYLINIDIHIMIRALKITEVQVYVQSKICTVLTSENYLKIGSTQNIQNSRISTLLKCSAQICTYPELQEGGQWSKRIEDVSVISARSGDGSPQLGVTQRSDERQDTAGHPDNQRHPNLQNTIQSFRL